MRLFRTLTLALALTASLALLTACAAAAPSYVSLGDSFTAGPFISVPTPPFGCLKSDRNYPHLVASSIGLPLRDASCSGARAGEMTQQLDSLDAETRIVSLTIGGNDVGFAEIARGCIALSPFGSPCKDRYVVGGRDLLAERIAAAAPLVASVLRAIHARSPAARTYLVNYPAIFPEAGRGCWPQLPIGFADAAYLRDKERQLNAMLAYEAWANGAALVDWRRASSGHDACKSAFLRWVEPLVPTNPAAPLHPNLAGMQGAAAALLAAIGSG